MGDTLFGQRYKDLTNKWRRRDSINRWHCAVLLTFS
jgi:hypothetical protein